MTQITPFYAAALFLLFVALSARVILLRNKHATIVGDGGNLSLRKALRAHSNFAEYVPMTLLLLFFWEQNGGGGLWLHGICSALLLGRVVHAIGVSRVNEDVRFRVAGMALTFTAGSSAAVQMLIGYVG